MAILQKIQLDDMICLNIFFILLVNFVSIIVCFICTYFLIDQKNTNAFMSFLIIDIVAAFVIIACNVHIMIIYYRYKLLKLQIKNEPLILDV